MLSDSPFTPHASSTNETHTRNKNKIFHIVNLKKPKAGTKILQNNWWKRKDNVISTISDIIIMYTLPLTNS